MDFIGMLQNFWESTGIYQGTDWRNYVMIAISFILFYLAIVRKFEPLLLLPIAFGMFVINIPGGADILYYKGYGDPELTKEAIAGLDKGLFWYLYQGVDKVIYPPLIFLGIGAMTDFGPLIANPKSMLIGAGAQLGIFLTLFGANILGFSDAASAAIAIIGGADGPTAIYVCQRLAPDLLSIIAIAAYSYMALIPIIQRPLMKLCTTKAQRQIKMTQSRVVSKREKIIFPISIILITCIILPDALPLLGMLMFGNLLKESTVTERLAKTASNELINIITIILGICVGSKAIGATFLAWDTIKVILLGLVAFCFGTLGGLATAQIMRVMTKSKENPLGTINPLIGSAGVSAVPMAARVSQNVALEDDKSNYLLMHAMGPNVAGVIGSGIAAGLLLAFFGG